MTAPVSTARINGIDLSYEVAGEGPLVVMVMGTGSPGRVWKANQEPALRKAGYRVALFDNRGIAPSSECAAGFTLEDMMDDAAQSAPTACPPDTPITVDGHRPRARVKATIDR